MYRDPIGHRIKTLNNLMRKTMDKQTGRPDRATLMHCWIIGFVEEREYIGLDTFPKDIEKELKNMGYLNVISIQTILEKL